MSRRTNKRKNKQDLSFNIDEGLNIFRNREDKNWHYDKDLRLQLPNDLKNWILQVCKEKSRERPAKFE